MDLSKLLSKSYIWKNLFGKKLNDKSLKLNDKPLKYDNEFSTNIDIFALAFSAEAYAKVTVFNSDDDVDDLEYYSAPSKLIGAGNAMLRYDLATKLSESASGTFKFVNANFEANQNIILSSYKIHPADITLEKAFLGDIVSLKNIYSKDDILALDLNEGLAVSFSGNMSTGIKLSYSDVFSGTLSQLLDFIPKDTNITATASASASISCSVKINDDFKLFIQKTGDDKYSLNINKAHANTIAADARLSISAQLIEDDAESLKKFTDSILSSLLGQPVEKVNTWVNQGMSKLGDTEKNLLSSVLDNIEAFKGIELTDDVINDLYKKYKTQVIDKTIEILTQKIEAGVSYEYQKSVKTNTLFSANLTTEAVESNLKEILLMKVDALEDKQGVDVLNYIFSKSTSISSKFGFQFAFGKFKAHWFNKKEFKFEESSDRKKKEKQITFSARRTHSQGGVNQKNWYLSFSGQTNGLMKIPITMDELNYSATLYWENMQKNTTAEELAVFVEMGIKWGCINANFEDTINDIKTKIEGKNNVKFSCEIEIPYTVFIALIPFLDQATIYQYADSISNAMPKFSNHWRAKVEDLSIYISLWKYYLENEESYDNYKLLASLCLQQLHNAYPDLANWEDSFQDGRTTKDQGSESFVGLIQQSDLHSDIYKLKEGLSELNEAIINKHVYNSRKIKDIFDDLDNIVANTGAIKTFNITVLGRFLLDIAIENNLYEDVSAIMKIEFEDDQEEMVFMKR